MESHLSLTPIKASELHLDSLPRATKKAFMLLSGNNLVGQRDLYLAGGTALSLQVGHRKSIDLDFFTSQKDFPFESLSRDLAFTDFWKFKHMEHNTLFGKVHDADVSFIAYPFFHPSPRMLQCGTIRMLYPEDIAVMKIIAISQRGRKRDFVDLYWYATHREPLIGVIKRVGTHFPGQEKNLEHFIKSLTYFVDAERDKMPALHFHTNWRTIKKFFQDEAKNLARDLLGIS